MFSKKIAKDDPNPWVKIPHEHDWLPVMDGAEENCGLCMIRRKIKKG